MTQKLFPSLAQLLLLFLFSNVYGQETRRWPAIHDEDLAFHNGCTLYSITEGISYANYCVTPAGSGIFKVGELAVHDPEFLEYGFARRWSIGMELSTDIFEIDPVKYYGYAGSPGQVQPYMWDLSLFASYHFIITKRLDVSGLAGLGFSAVTINGKDGDSHYHYNSVGHVTRVGLRATYYLWKNTGLTGMVSRFDNYNLSGNFGGNTFGRNYVTEVNGYAWELGMCRRFH